ncbi:hypothetical protein ACFLZ6_00100 [Nanoarchaeota archaeon]
MKIQLDETYSIQGDAHQWILSKSIGEKEANIGYYADLKVLLQHYIDQSSRCNESIKTMKDLLEYQKNLVAGLNKALTPLKIETRGKQNG